MQTRNPEASDSDQIAHAVEAMIARYGDKARHQAAIRARELSGEGDPEAASLWRRVEHALVARAPAPTVSTDTHD